MTTPNYRALCAELSDSVELLLQMRNSDRPMQITEDRLSRARAALAEPVVGEGPTMPAAIDDMPEAQRRWYVLGWRAAIASMAALAAKPDHFVDVPKMVEPAEGEVAELVKWLRENADDERQICGVNQASLNLDCAANLLERLAAEPEPLADGEVAELPPRPPLMKPPAHPALERYGVTWDGSPDKPLLTRMADGCWTPWHVAADLLERLAPQPVPEDQELYDYWISTSPEFGCGDPVGFARAVLARWGRA